MQKTRADRILERIDPSFKRGEESFTEQSNLGAMPCTVCGYVGLPTDKGKCTKCGSDIGKKKDESRIDELEDTLIKAANKMVDNIEKKRTEGKYSDEDREKLVKKFVVNMKKVSTSK